MTGGSPQTPLWRAVLDANILLQAPIRDTILRLAQARVIVVHWTRDILAEVERTFAAVTGSTDAERRYEYLRATLHEFFPYATVEGYQNLRPSLTIAPHDRHVLACAIRARAQIIVTYNLRHFSAAELRPYNIQAWHPDALLRDILRQRPDTLLDSLIAQGEDLHPPRTLAQVLDRLAGDVPRFVSQARAQYGL